MHNESMKVTSDMLDEKACTVGVLAFAFEMHKKLTEKREQGIEGWNNPKQVSLNFLKEKFEKAVKEKNMINAGNYAMMIFHRERMEENG